MFHEHRELISELKNTDLFFQKMFKEHNDLDTKIDKLENDVVKSVSREEEIEEMHQILIKMDEIEDPKESGKLDMQFHNKLIEASHNRMIVLYTSMIAELINQFIADFRVRIMANQRQADALRRAHWNIYDSLVAKDFVAGSFAMQRHFDIVGEQLERLQQ